jgi:hypothetical protein
MLSPKQTMAGRVSAAAAGAAGGAAVEEGFGAGFSCLPHPWKRTNDAIKKIRSI